MFQVREGLRRSRPRVQLVATRPLPAAKARVLPQRATIQHAALVVIFLGVAWRTLRYLLAFPLWGDEAFLATSLLTRDLAGLSRPLEFGQIAPPGFLWAELAVVRLVGTSEWALRLIPYLAGVSSLVLFYGFCKGVATRRTSLLAVAILAASLYPARHANEVKPYSTDLLLSLVLTMLGWAVHQDPRRVGRWVGLVTLAMVSVWCSYTAVFPVFAVGLLLGVGSLRKRSLRLFLATSLYGGLALLSWAAMMIGFARPQMAESSWLSVIWADGFPPLSRPWLLPGWLLSMHTGNMMAYPVGGRNLASSITFVMVVIGAIGMIRRRPRRPLLLLLLGPMIAGLAAAVAGRYPYGVSARVSLYMAPAFCLLAAEGVMAIFKWRGRVHRGTLLLTLVLCLVPIVAACCDLAEPYSDPQDREYRAIARGLAGASDSEDRWIVFDGADPLPLTADVMTSKWVQRVAKLRFYLLRYAPTPPLWEPDPNHITPSPGRRTWVILHDHGCEPMYPRDRRTTFERLARAKVGSILSYRWATPDHSTIDVIASRASGHDSSRE